MLRRKGLGLAFGRVVREQRLSAGFSQEELAFRSKIHPTYLSQLERGLKSPSLDVIGAISEALKQSPHALLLAAEAGEANAKALRRRVSRAPKSPPSNQH